jgi:X-X-X-Leu-X-X-Gly heptad repeat protein
LAFEEVSRVMGPGWPTPYNLIVVPRNGPVTTPAMLASIDRLQTQIARDKRVASVSGPAAINSTSLQLKKFGPSLVHSAQISKQSKKDLLRLINGLGQAGAGSDQLKAGLQQAVSGAGQLHSGSGQAHAGSVALHNGLLQASAGSVKLNDGLNQALSGAEQLKTGASQALIGSTQLLRGVGLAQGPAAQSLPALHTLAGTVSQTANKASTAKANAAGAADAVARALASLQNVTSTDPAVKTALANAIDSLTTARADAGNASSSIADVAGSASSANFLAASIEYAAPGLMAAINMLHDGASQLASGIEQLRNGNAQLAGGIGQLAGGGGQLRSGLGQLTNGAGQLEAGLALLNSGTGQLAVGLQPAPAGAGAIASGLGVMQAAVTKARGQIPSTKDLETLMTQSPGMFSSGYFVLAAVDGARGSDRNAATFTVNLAHGGTAGQIMVVSKYASSDPRSLALHSRLITLAGGFGRTQHAEVAVGGPGANITDLTAATRSKVWLDVVVISLVLMLVLAIALRAILLPAVTVAVNVLTVAAAFGLVQLLFGGPNPPLGGPGYLDPISVISIFTVAIGVTMTYSALVLMRTREAYTAGAPYRESVSIGVERTAAAATGAAIVTVAALTPFATTELINIRELGIGVGVALLLHALIVRPVVLPAMEALLGRAGWWPTKGTSADEPEPPRPSRPDRSHVVRKRSRPRVPRPLHH